jgi:hypothetical protein
MVWWYYSLSLFVCQVVFGITGQSRLVLMLPWKVFMPIRIKRRDKNSYYPQLPDRSIFMTDTAPVLRASYTALETVFGVLYGSI